MSDDLPAPFKAFRAEFPELAQAYDALGSAAHECGPLDQKARSLVKLGLAIGSRSEGGVHSHTRRALAAGATRAEVMQVLALAVTSIGFAPTVAAYTWMRDELGDG